MVCVVLDGEQASESGPWPLVLTVLDLRYLCAHQVSTHSD